MIKKGMRVSVTCDGGDFELQGAAGTVDDVANVAPHQLPIQVLLDTLYDNSRQTVLRFRPDEVIPLDE